MRRITAWMDRHAAHCQTPHSTGHTLSIDRSMFWMMILQSPADRPDIGHWTLDNPPPDNFFGLPGFFLSWLPLAWRGRTPACDERASGTTRRHRGRRPHHAPKQHARPQPQRFPLPNRRSSRRRPDFSLSPPGQDIRTHLLSNLLLVRKNKTEIETRSIRTNAR